METKTQLLSAPLAIDQIDFRIQSINNGGYAIVLPYKDARVDMNRLNKVYGIGYWQRKHEFINGKEYCSVGVWNADIKQWCFVQDVGTASKESSEKGQSSDAFKRACFNLGIGIELYDYPLIQVKLRSDEFKPGQSNQKPKATWKLKPKDWSWYSQFNDDGNITFLAAKDGQGMRFKWGSFKK